ncbi:low affinity Fe/Cu permease [Rhizobium leguminosarum]|nr:low affinity Fe/Cu permease [Rhizobium leguminosarum]
MRYALAFSTDFRLGRLMGRASRGPCHLWAAAGLSFSFPRQWFLLTNMMGTLIIFFILLLVQHSQNRDMVALQTKLNELIRSSKAGNHWIAAEKKEAEAIEEMRQQHHDQMSEPMN